jgi:hypothetical protein
MLEDCEQGYTISRRVWSDSESKSNSLMSDETKGSQLPVREASWLIKARQHFVKRGVVVLSYLMVDVNVTQIQG